jgi:Mg2+/citrate symporter
MIQTIDIESYISKRFEPERKWYSQKARENKKWMNILNVIVIFTGATTPILAALQFTPATVFISAITTLCFSVLRFFKFDELWLNYRSTSEMLKKEEQHFRTLTGPYADVINPEKLFVERTESLISKEQSVWLNAMQGEKKKQDEIGKTV